MKKLLLTMTAVAALAALPTIASADPDAAGNAAAGAAVGAGVGFAVGGPVGARSARALVEQSVRDSRRRASAVRS